MLDLKFFQKIDANVVAKYRKHIFDPDGNGQYAKDVYGKKYKKYSEGYSKAKKTGKLTRQRTQFKDSTAPVLSGDLMNDFQLRKTSGSGFSFGTVSWGSTAKFLADKGRIIANNKKPLPNNVSKYIMKEADNYVTKELRKIKGGTINI